MVSVVIHADDRDVSDRVASGIHGHDATIVAEGAAAGKGAEWAIVEDDRAEIQIELPTPAVAGEQKGALEIHHPGAQRVDPHERLGDSRVAIARS